MAIAVLAAAGCDDDLGSITAFAPGTAQMAFNLAGPTHITFKTDLEIEASERLEDALGAFEYTIEAHQRDRVVATARCDPLRLGSSFSRSRRPSANRIGSFRHSVTKAVLVGCALDVPSGGPTTLRILLAKHGQPKVNLIHLELVAQR